VLSLGVQVIRTARRRPGVVGTLIEPFSRSNIGASSRASLFMPWEYCKMLTPPALSVNGLLAGTTVGPPGPGAVLGAGLVPVQPTRASSPITSAAPARGSEVLWAAVRTGAAESELFTSSVVSMPTVTKMVGGRALYEKSP
jgi:hypothetical protein